MNTIEPALPKKTLGRNHWTEREVEILMDMARKFADEGKRVKWREIASATGHHESSCALKYHTIRSRAAGRLARELIDADLAAKDPARPTTQLYGGKGAPVWSNEDDVRLLAMCQDKAISGEAAWRTIAEGFPGRSFLAVRQRYVTLRNQANGIARDRDRKSRPLSPAKPVIREAKPVSVPPAEYKTITAAFCKDPPPGRSALDKRNAGIVDEPAMDHRKAQQYRIRKITLPGAPLR